MIKKYNIGLIQTFSLIIGIVVGGGIINLPGGLAQIIRQNAWLTILAGGAISIIILNIGLSLNSDWPDKTLLEISKHLLGKWLGTGLNVLFLFYFVAIGGLSLRVAMSLTATWILPNTPLEILSGLFLITAFYLARNGLQAVARFSELIIMILLPFTLLIFVPFYTWDFKHLLPFGGFSLSEFVAASSASLYSFLGFEIIFFFYPFIKGNKRDIRLTANLALLLIILMYTILTVFVIASFSHESLHKELYTTLIYSQLIRFPVVERVEFFLLFFWIFALFHTYALLYYFGYSTFESLIPLKDKNLGIILIIPIYYISIYPHNIAQLGHIAGIASSAGAAFLLSAIFILKGISLIKKRMM